MALVMDASEFAEAYPNGMDEDDRAVWAEAVARCCDHDEAVRAAETLGRDRLHCPTCGEEVSASEILTAWELDAEARAERAIGC